ncbi:MAG: DUF2155 domain-containing protein [Pontixanthobacter sp.]
MGTAALLTACGGTAVEAPEPDDDAIPEELQVAAPRSTPATTDGDAAQVGSPMEDRVATLGLLNKRNNVSRDVELKPGEQKRFGNVVLRLAACERTAPWEMPRETGGFVQVSVRDTGGEREWRRVFSGWLFAESPSLNVVEHPIYDVWMKDCAMSFPGEEAAESDDADAPSDDTSQSSET